MRVHAVTTHQPGGVRDALRGRGWDVVRAEAAAGGLAPRVIAVDGLSAAEGEAIRAAALRIGVECLSGDDWVVLAGGTARLSALARPDGAPPELARLSQELGRLLVATPEDEAEWLVRGHAISLHRPVVVGILNVTPDSFSDGGRFHEAAAAVRHAAIMIQSGAGLLDVGAESTRPGERATVTADEEWARLEPVLQGLRDELPGALVSVDTRRSETAARALDLGAAVINDVTGLRADPGIARVCAAAGAGLILMHSRGGVDHLASYDHAEYGAHAAQEIAGELAAAVERARASGVPAEALVVDPGLGFQKRPEHNWHVLNNLETITQLGHPVLIGPSRKRFVRDATRAPLDRADEGSAVVCALAWAHGARLFRVHDVARAREALGVAEAWAGA